MKLARVPFILLALLPVGGYVLYRGSHFSRAQTSENSQTPCCGQTTQTAPREIDFPYFSLRDGFNSTLLLVSASPRTMDLTVAVRGLAGETMLAPMSIQPQEKLAVDLKSLLTGLSADVNGAFAEGSVSVYFQGTIMPLVGQLTVTNPTLSLIHESMMVENDPGHGDLPAVLNGLWWGLGGGRDARIMVSNTSGDLVAADVFLDFSGVRQASSPLAFLPHETKVLSVTKLLTDSNASPAQAPEGGITIVPHGPRPTLIAQGKIVDPATGFSTTLNFPLPQVQQASALHASGVPIGTPSKDSPFARMGTFIPHVILRNLLPSPQNVTITIEYPDVGAGLRPALLNLAPAPLDGYATKDISLDLAMGQLPLPLPYCSIRIQYSGPPGSALAEVSSIEVKRDLVIDSRLANEGDGWAGSGANPWHLDDETESVLFLTNMGEQDARIGFRVDALEVPYFLTDLKLTPHETRAIDLRKLRDAQQPDFQKNKIPAAATDGSVIWIRLENVPVMGRLVVIQHHRGVASSYDCNICKCPADYSNLSVSPASFSILPGQTMQCACKAQYTDCNAVVTYNTVTSSATWISSNTAVATMDSTTKGLVHAVAGGTANINASYTGFTYTYDPVSRQCDGTPDTLTAPSACDVQVLDHFSISVTSTPVSGETNSLVSGQSGNVQVQAIDTLGGVMTLYRGTASFSSTDTTATLPANYTYTATDSGTHTFSVTLKTVSGTSATRGLTVKDTGTGKSSTQNVYVWFDVLANVEFWKNCCFTACPNSGSYFCQTAYNASGYSQPTAFVALPYSSLSLYNQTVTVRAGATRVTTSVDDAGPNTTTNNYWNTGTPPPAPAACVTDLLYQNLGLGSLGCTASGCSNACGGSACSNGASGGSTPNVVNPTLYWRFGS